MRNVLIISHNAMSSETNNGRTLLELFNNYNKDNIAQLFLHPDSVDCDFCERYYQITEMDILKNFFRPSEIGKEIYNCDISLSEDKKKTTEIYKLGSRKSSFLVLIRNMIWEINLWFNNHLKKWLYKFNPEIIFLFAGGSSFSLKLTLKIAKFLHVPIISFWTDDYFINNANKKGFFGLLNNSIYKKLVCKIMKKGEYISLTDLMLKEYDKTFKKQGSCIYTTSSVVAYGQKKHNEKLIFSYLGNISWGRYNSLIDIANVIIDNDLPIILNVYTAENRAWILNNILNIKGLNYCGKIPYENVKKVIEESDAVIHVEDFFKNNIEAVKYSLSTKVADSLASNRCLFAYGPKEVASIDYLIKNQCAIIANNKEELKECLKNIVATPNLLDDTAKSGIYVAEKNHNKNNNYLKLQEIFERTKSNK